MSIAPLLKTSQAKAQLSITASYTLAQTAKLLSYYILLYQGSLSCILDCLISALGKKNALIKFSYCSSLVKRSINPECF